MAQWSQDSRRLLLTIPPDAVENLCNAYEQAIANEKIDSLILIPTFICDFLCIHPFYDGNGRMSRLFALPDFSRNHRCKFRSNGMPIPLTAA